VEVCVREDPVARDHSLDLAVSLRRKATGVILDGLSQVYWAWCAPLLVSAASSGISTAGGQNGVSSVSTPPASVYLAESLRIAVGGGVEPQRRTLFADASSSMLEWALSKCHDIALGNTSVECDQVYHDSAPLEAAAQAAELLDGYARVALAILAPLAPTHRARDLHDLRQTAQVVLTTLHLQLADASFAGEGGVRIESAERFCRSPSAECPTLSGNCSHVDQ